MIISPFSYIVSEYSTEETALKIMLNSNINYMNIKIELENTYYNFHEEKQTIYNLRVGNKYYFYKHIQGTYEQGINKVYLDLMMDYIDNNPFESIKVFEVDADIKTNIKGGLWNISSEYSIIGKYTGGVVFELSPNYNISYLKVVYEEFHINFEDGITFLFIFIPIALAICIIIILVIYIIKRYKSKAKNLNYPSLHQTQNLVPVES